ncbi:MAG: ribose-5-phosphate isomerase RpiA [Pseudomonadota bacterium]|nr:ribose-5-phosphate isomerase RpiA [Pseudomonadota bacterium]
MDAHALKQAVAKEAINRVESHQGNDIILGIGTGSTAECFIAELPKLRDRIKTTVSSSERSSALLLELGFEVQDLNAVDRVDVYVDGADEATQDGFLIKGGGAALTREKIAAAKANEFICIADSSKLVTTLGRFPLPVEVIPMARTLVRDALNSLGGDAVWREGVVTDNGNIILDVQGLIITDPLELESAINNMTGVVCNGIFAHRPADVLLISNDLGVVRVL